jgi:hypothetical protein
VFIQMDKLMRMKSIDAILTRDGSTVRDTIPRKLIYMAKHVKYFYRLSRSLRIRGQTVPVAVGMDEDTGEPYLVNGHNRVILAWLMRWQGMSTTSESSESVDRAWNRIYRREYADWDW